MDDINSPASTIRYKDLSNYDCLISGGFFCLSTKVPRHSAGGIGSSYIRAYMVRIDHNAHARVMEAENSITLTIYTSVKVFIAL